MRGFTLIELIVVMVVLAIGAIAAMHMAANAGMHQTSNRDLQVGTQLLQECAEYILAQHRRDEAWFGATLATSGNCYGMTSFQGFNAPSVTVTDHTGLSGCATGGTCKLVTITLSKSGATLNPVSMILSDY